jgi:hypothetical protein
MEAESQTIRTNDDSAGAAAIDSGAQDAVKAAQDVKKVVNAGPTCEGGVCPLCTPFGLATFFVGFMVVFYTQWPIQLLGWLTVASGYAYAGWLSLRTRGRAPD